MLVHPSGVDVSSSALRFLAAQLRERRRALGVRWRRPSAGRQALLTLAHLRNGHPYAQLAAGFGIGTTTAYRYILEARCCRTAKRRSWELEHGGIPPSRMASTPRMSLRRRPSTGARWMNVSRSTARSLWRAGRRCRPPGATPQRRCSGSDSDPALAHTRSAVFPSMAHRLVVRARSSTCSTLLTATADGKARRPEVGMAGPCHSGGIRRGGCSPPGGPSGPG